MGELNPNLSLTLALTDEEPPEGWTGRTGRISSEMVSEEIPDYRDWVFYVCGPPRMVEGMAAMLRDDLALPKEKVITEDFKGY
jgi:Na+-transporting NADH:ubiquinone oxidoreductase subunit NqrF